METMSLETVDGLPEKNKQITEENQKRGSDANIIPAMARSKCS